jgi:hypothetical protein
MYSLYSVADADVIGAYGNITARGNDLVAVIDHGQRGGAENVVGVEDQVIEATQRVGGGTARDVEEELVGITWAEGHSPEIAAKPDDNFATTG